MLVRHLVPRLHIHNVPSIEHTDRYSPDFASGLKGQHIPGHAPFIMFLFTSFTRATRTGATQRLTSCEASVGYVLRILESDLALDVSGVLADQHFCESVATQHHHQKSSPRLLRIALPLLNKPSCLHLILPTPQHSSFRIRTFRFLHYRQAYLAWGRTSFDNCEKTSTKRIRLLIKL